MLYLQQNRKNALDRIPEMFVNKVPTKVSTDLVNTKPIIPHRVGEQRLVYTLTPSRLGIFHHYSPPFQGIVVYYSGESLRVRN